MRFFMPGARENEGFTVIELMVTMLILGILVGIVIATMMLSRNKAKESACKANIRILHGAIVQWQAAHEGVYPQVDDMDELFNLLVPEGYLRKEVSCPGEGTYTYDMTDGTVTCSIASHNP